MIKKKCICDYCSKEGDINPSWGIPNNWIDLLIKVETQQRLNGHYCSKKCLIKQIDLQMV